MEREKAAALKEEESYRKFKEEFRTPGYIPECESYVAKEFLISLFSKLCFYFGQTKLVAYKQLIINVTTL